jgi:FlaA1/EpsC-like NDP-sugar epimerase
MIQLKIPKKVMTMFDRDPAALVYLRKKFMALFNKHPVPRWMLYILDSISVYLIFIFAYLLRYNLIAADFPMVNALKQALVVTGVYALFSFLFKSFSGLIRHTTIKDIFNVFISCFLSLVTLIALSLVSRSAGWGIYTTLPISILMIHFLAITAFQLAIRILIKMFFELITHPMKQRKNVVIFGAGSMGAIVMNVILADRENEFQIECFFDNNKVLQGRKLNGIKVLSPRKLTKQFLEENEVDTMIFAIKNIPPHEKSDIIRTAVEVGLEVLDTPHVDTWLNGQLQVRNLKPVKLEDLLGRDPIQLNMDLIGKGLMDKTIMVTGAAGSIGSEIVRQLTRFETRQILLIDNAETPMFHLEREMKKYYSSASVKPILADVTDQIKMDRIFREYKPQVVFHAAAYKHVPLMEENPHEALRVNVGGTTVITNLALKHKVRRFVMVSTDKAVNPTNVMGASKRMCEMILQARTMEPGNRTQFMITRFGNVLGSSGSVIPIFTRQIQEGGPVTVTHPEITRYFMTIPEACQLVLEAGFMGMGGEIFVFDMGDPVKIDNLARQMIRLSGFVPDEDIRIEYTGLRPGEKLFEELLAAEEKTLPTYNPKVKVAEVAWLDHIALLDRIHTVLYTAPNLTEQDLINRLEEIVPEYTSSNEKYRDVTDDTASIEMDAFPD